ncbi:MAG: hypothetical protein M5U34_06895 [Chloroflexi bacterium]|nr:hypothetical protein [Chloroflexota bacterium]
MKRGLYEKEIPLCSFTTHDHCHRHSLFVVVIIVLQLWLFTSTMNAYLGGDSAILLPAAIASLVCLGLNVGLLWYLYELDR